MLFHELAEGQEFTHAGRKCVKRKDRRTALNCVIDGTPDWLPTHDNVELIEAAPDTPPPEPKLEPIG